MKEQALSRFRRQPEPLNCAQSVVYAYQQVTGDTRLSIEEMKAFGGGRAPGGICGALHSACVLAPEKSEQLKQRFAAIAGSVLCKELKQGQRTACETCVSEASSLLSSELGLSR